MDNLNKINPIKKERILPTCLNLADQSTLNTTNPVLVINSPKTPTLSRKLKAVSLDSDPPVKETASLELSRDVFSMPNTPKKQIKHKLSADFDDGTHRITLAPVNSNLKKFASNSSISGSQTLKTLPEIMTLHDFGENPAAQPVRIKSKGLLERRGSNASLTIDLGSNSSIAEAKPAPLSRLNTAKSVSNLNLTAFGSQNNCNCVKKSDFQPKCIERRKSQETCGNCIIYESVPSKGYVCAVKCHNQKKCSCSKSRRKSLSNENLYVPPCGFCQSGSFKDCSGGGKHCKGYRKAYYPRQPDLESSQLLSEDFKLHLQNIQYLQTAGNTLSVADLKQTCEMTRVPKLHQEFWEVPLNLQEKCYVSGSQSRNRYRGFLPNEHSRVHLPGPQSYIHANYIKGPDYTETTYIATQGPMAHTCQDFWEMVWFTNCKCIVMLTNLIEKGRNKCELYFPLGKSTRAVGKSYYTVRSVRAQDKFTFESKNVQAFEEDVVDFEEINEVTFGSYRIRYLKREHLGDCVIRHLEVSRKERPEEVRVLHHYWLASWPDHKMANPDQVLKMAMQVASLAEKLRDLQQDPSLEGAAAGKKKANFAECRLPAQKPSERKKSVDNSRSPLVVHCSAGIGRTGCFLAILNGIQQLKRSFNVDVLAILCSLRLNRGGMVQTAEQYELIHRVLNLYAEKM
ncbi:unnamed protein product [Brassicogethes aeneus]|uniref:protein-tyrosine-phosphatase n=1 Tax=Brassicogethes aeneus TaxID=1431903 RepID=A0A9P0FBF7_BRAAE|nr:unnamed protein product [Brassicogethes aeneus]